MDDLEPSKITAVAIRCQSDITGLLGAIQTKESYVEDVLCVRDVKQMQDRYDQWAGNLGALQPSESPLSLAHRLREAPLVSKSVWNTLWDLSVSIQGGKLPSA